MERYTSLYRLPENQYTAGSPVLLEAGALLKDSRTGAVLVQLKMRSVSAKPIRAVMVAVDAFDVSGAPLEGVAEYQYLDLSVPRDEPFGQHQAIVLPDANTRRASVRCTRVVFADGTSWEADPSAVWSPLPERTALEEALSPELAEQYRRDTAACAQMLPQRCGSLWSCACGALNSAEEKVCHRCGLSLDAQLAALDETVLREHLAAYKEAEAKKAEELCRREKERQAQRRRKTKKTLAVVLPAAAVCAAAVILTTTVIVPNQKHKEALALIEAGDYTAAYAMLEELGKPEEITQNKYDRAMELIAAEDYEPAYELLEEIGREDAVEENKCDRALVSLDKGEYKTALDLLKDIGRQDEFTEQSKRDWAAALLAEEKYIDAYRLLKEIGDEDAITENKRARANALLKQGKYDKAYSFLREIGDTEVIAASKYDRALEEITDEDYIAAYTLLDGLVYRDSEEKRESIKPQYHEALLKNADVGSKVFFGKYEQDNDTSNGKEDIEWIVLAKEDGRILVTSKFGLDYQPFNTKRVDVTWDTCTLRRWLNGTFINTAFSSEEKRMIPIVTIETYKHTRQNGNFFCPTEDRVFLLTIDEAKEYFPSDSVRACMPTPAAASVAYSASLRNDGHAYWWLRSQGYRRYDTVCVVDPDGSLCFGDRGEMWVNSEGWGIVRPVMWISLEE